MIKFHIEKTQGEYKSGTVWTDCPTASLFFYEVIKDKSKKHQFTFVDLNHKLKTEVIEFDENKSYGGRNLCAILGSPIERITFTEDVGYFNYCIAVRSSKEANNEYKYPSMVYRIIETKTTDYGRVVSIKLSNEMLNKIQNAGIDIHYLRECYTDYAVVVGSVEISTMAELEKIRKAVGHPLIVFEDTIEIYNDYRE